MSLDRFHQRQARILHGFDRVLLALLQRLLRLLQFLHFPLPLFAFRFENAHTPSSSKLQLVRLLGSVCLSDQPATTNTACRACTQRPGERTNMPDKSTYIVEARKPDTCTQQARHGKQKEQDLELGFGGRNLRLLVRNHGVQLRGTLLLQFLDLIIRARLCVSFKRSNSSASQLRVSCYSASRRPGQVQSHCRWSQQQSTIRLQ